MSMATTPTLQALGTKLANRLEEKVRRSLEEPERTRVDQLLTPENQTSISLSLVNRLASPTTSGKTKRRRRSRCPATSSS